MNNETVVKIEIFGKIYQIKCPDNEVTSLKAAASYLEQKMHTLQDTGKLISIDRIAVMTALNITHEFLNSDTHQLKTIQKTLSHLYSKLEDTLSQQNKELFPAE